jgi:hypothetical protein
MRCLPWFLVAAFFLHPTIGYATGGAFSANFDVTAPSDEIAVAVAEKAELYRRQAALEWLGKALPHGRGPTMITVMISDTEVDGLTWPVDSPERKFHQIWTTTSPQHVTGEVLHHEVVHTVLDTFTGTDFLPAWASEGIASQVDEPRSKEIRRGIALGWAARGDWPPLSGLFQSRKIAHNDDRTYAAAASVTEFLATLRGKPEVVRFAQMGQRAGWDQAARACYGARDVAELEAMWHDWVAGRSAQRAVRFAAASPQSGTSERPSRLSANVTGSR